MRIVIKFVEPRTGARVRVVSTPGAAFCFLPRVNQSQCQSSSSANLMIECYKKTIEREANI